MAKTDNHPNPMIAKPEIKYLDRLPPGWFALDVLRTGQRGWDWAALVIDVDPDNLKNCSHHGWFRVPGKHRSRDAAWGAFEEIMATRH